MIVILTLSSTLYIITCDATDTSPLHTRTLIQLNRQLTPSSSRPTFAAHANTTNTQLHNYNYTMSTIYDFSEIFGAELQSKSGTIETNSVLSGKHVMVYFSAHWCPPCRGFTPSLIKVRERERGRVWRSSYLLRTHNTPDRSNTCRYLVLAAVL